MTSGYLLIFNKHNWMIPKSFIIFTFEKIIMKSRSEIGYLTILGLSLTVVLTVYKENKPLKAGDAGTHEIVKAHLLQTGGNLSSSYGNGVLCSPKGSSFLFANSSLFTNIFLSSDYGINGTGAFETSFFSPWLEASGNICIHITSFINSKDFSTLIQLIEMSGSFNHAGALNPDNLFLFNSIAFSKFTLCRQIDEYFSSFFLNSTPSRAGPFQINSLV